MTQGAFSSENTRPGRVLHVAVTVVVGIYAAVVEICESQLGPFEGFLLDVGIFSVLRIGFVVVGLADLAFTLLSGGGRFWWVPLVRLL